MLTTVWVDAVAMRAFDLSSVENASATRDLTRDLFKAIGTTGYPYVFLLKVCYNYLDVILVQVHVPCGTASCGLDRRLPGTI